MEFHREYRISIPQSIIPKLPLILSGKEAIYARNRMWDFFDLFHKIIIIFHITFAATCTNQKEIRINGGNILQNQYHNIVYMIIIVHVDIFWETLLPFSIFIFVLLS